MKKYETPIMNLTKFNCENVLTLSSNLLNAWKEDNDSKLTVALNYNDMIEFLD
jgi:hypothetical protein